MQTLSGVILLGIADRIINHRLIQYECQQITSSVIQHYSCLVIGNKSGDLNGPRTNTICVVYYQLQFIDKGKINTWFRYHYIKPFFVMSCFLGGTAV